MGSAACTQRSNPIFFWPFLVIHLSALTVEAECFSEPWLNLHRLFGVTSQKTLSSVAIVYSVYAWSCIRTWARRWAKLFSCCIVCVKCCNTIWYLQKTNSSFQSPAISSLSYVTCLVTPWAELFFRSWLSPILPINFPQLYGTRVFIVVFVRTLNRSLTWATSSPHPPRVRRLVFHIILWDTVSTSKWSSPLGCCDLNVLVVYPMRAKYPAIQPTLLVLLQ